MKKQLFFTIILSLVLVSCKSKKQVVDIEFWADTRCNLDTPGWGESLGVVSFATDRIWTISNDTITQIWSDVVTATNCQKTTFNGGKGYRKRHQSSEKNYERANFNADCSSNPNYSGDFFSWCAVVRFQDTLCPAPWHVPSLQDFIDLDIALGGNGKNRHQEIVNGHSWQTQLDWYLNTWGGVYTGTCKPDGWFNEFFVAHYWSLEQRYNAGCNLHFTSAGHIWPNIAHSHYAGFLLRCIR
jgi:uncharacterized protein (TIGR02145 family)